MGPYNPPLFTAFFMYDSLIELHSVTIFAYSPISILSCSNVFIYSNLSKLNFYYFVLDLKALVLFLECLILLKGDCLII